MKSRAGKCVLLSFLLFVVPTFAAQDQTNSSASSATGNASQPAVSKGQRVGFSEQIAATQLIHQVRPAYPAAAKQAQVVGIVVLHIIVGTNGLVSKLDPVSGPPLLIDSTIEAVRQWRYKPMLLNAQPVEVDTTATIEYTVKGASKYKPPHPQPTRNAVTAP